MQKGNELFFSGLLGVLVYVVRLFVVFIDLSGWDFVLFESLFRLVFFLIIWTTMLLGSVPIFSKSRIATICITLNIKGMKL